MSWGFQNVGPPSANPGQDLDEITTNLLGFSALAGETKLRLLPQPWPEQQLPPTTSSLLSIASRKGLIAAAGPDCLVIASTEAVRKAYHADVPAQDNVKPFTPQATISVPRLSQVAFSSDESCLVITAESGGGFNVYDVDALLQGKQDPAFQLPTNNTAIRALLPNPAPDFAHLYAVVLADGKLVLANLKDRQIGNVVKEGVSCVSWSAKGKQLVAGLQDGTAVQYDPQGNLKATIPKPAQVDQSLPMTTISWVTNDEFLTIHTPISGDDSDSVYHMLYRDKASGTFTSRKLSGDPCPAFGMPRTPASHFIARLRQFPPNLDEMLIISSTAAVDVGVVSKASVSLADDDMASENAVNTFTTTGMAQDTRRAQTPMSATGDTSPIGMALDLSSTTNVIKPIPSEEMDESATPAPALMLLNNEGVLCTWWVIYNDSIRQKTAYPGLVSVSSSPSQPAQPSSFGAAASTPSAFGSSAPAQPAFGSTSTFGKPSQPAFGSVGFAKPAAPAFGSPSAPSGFGGASALGSQSPWGAASTGNAGSTASPTFGKPAFGSSTAIGASAGGFGAASGLGAKTSPWGKPADAQTSPVGTFGQASPVFGSGAASSGASAFASLGAKATDKPAFAGGDQKPSLASPFSSFGNNATSSSGDSKPSTFGQPSFGNNATSNSGESKPSTFGQPSFGSTVTLPSSAGGSFGSASTIGVKQSPWSTPAPETSPVAPAAKEEAMSDDTADKSVESSQETAKPTKQSPFGNLNISTKPSIFGQPSETEAESSTKSPFFSPSVFGQPSDKPAQKSPLAPKSPSVFGQPSDKPAQKSPFAQLGADKSSPSIFGQPSEKSVQSTFGQPSAAAANFSGFKLGSTFQPTYSDDSAADEDDEEEAAPSKDAGKSKAAGKTKDAGSSKDGGKSLFGSAFTNVLGEAAKESPKEPETPIKKEPGIDEPKLRDISYTPATVHKPAQEEAAEPDDAPLPPDFTTYKPRPVEEDLPPIAGSPPIDLGNTSQLSSPVSSIGEEEDEAEDEEEDDGDDEEDIDGPADDDDESWEGAESDEEEEEEVESEQDDTVSRPPKTEAANAFGSRMSFPTEPMTAKKVKKPLLPSTTPAGFPKGPPIFPAPKPRASPRSPSPIRPLDRSVGPAPARSTSGQSSSRQPLTMPSMPAKPASRPSSAAQKPPPPPAEPEEGELSDDEDLRIQEILREPVDPSKDLEPFVAHQDYLGSTTKPGIGGQIEKVYRDINSMIDTLGLNVRSLQAFVKGHEELCGNDRERSDLEDPEDWCLVEIDNLSVVEKNLGDSLDNGKVDHVNVKINELNELYKSSTNLRTRTADMRKQIASRTDPEKRNAQRAAALATEAQMQQTELRQGVTKVQKLLQEAEEALSVLRAELATASTATNQSTQRVPTVEAVTKTIMKMTAMIERKSGDVDVLEAQIRRLPQGLAGLSLDDDAASSSADFMRSSVRSVNSGGHQHHGAQNPFMATPPTRRSMMQRSTTQPQLGMSGMFGTNSITSRFQTTTSTPKQTPARKSQSTYGFAYTPEESGSVDFRSSVRSVDFRSSVRSVNGGGSSRKKKMSDVSPGEVGRYLEKREQRRRVLDALKSTVEKRGARVAGVE